MKIGQAAEKSGLPAKTIRYYESIGLFKGGRDDNGYRNYKDEDISQMHFLQRSRQLGFTLEECKDLLALYQDPHRASSSVKSVAETRLQLIDQHIEHLLQMKTVLSGLVKQCPGDQGADCIILEELSK